MYIYRLICTYTHIDTHPYNFTPTYYLYLYRTYPCLCLIAIHTSIGRSIRTLTYIYTNTIYSSINVCMYIDSESVCIWIQRYIHTFPHTYIRTYILTYIHTYIPIHICTHKHTHIHIIIHIHVFMYLKQGQYLICLHINCI